MVPFDVCNMHNLVFMGGGITKCAYIFKFRSIIQVYFKCQLFAVIIMLSVSMRNQSIAMEWMLVFWVLGIVLGTGCWFLSTAYSTGRCFLDKLDQSFAPAPSCLTMH